MTKTATSTALMIVLMLAGGAALADEPAPPTPEQIAKWHEEAEERLHTDYGDLKHYAADDEKRIAAHEQVRVVFMGDSITQNWADWVPDFFVNGYVGRGISGQTTAQMLLRFRQDVLDLKPKVIHLMAGTNDLAGNFGPVSPQQLKNNIMTMVELAQAHHIRVVLAGIPPALDFPWHKGLDPAPKIAAHNAWLKDYAARVGALYVDYKDVVGDGQGGFKPDLASDGVHPTVAGYKLIAPLADETVKKVLGKAK